MTKTHRMKRILHRTGWLYPTHLVPTSDDTLMSHRNSVTPRESYPPQGATRNARRHLAASQNGYFPMKKYRSSTPPATEQRQTSFMREGYPTPPLRTRPPSTRNSAHSSSSRSDFAGTSAATPSLKPRPRSTPLYSRPFEDTGDMSTSSPFQ